MCKLLMDVELYQFDQVCISKGLQWVHGIRIAGIGCLGEIEYFTLVFTKYIIMIKERKNHENFFFCRNMRALY